MLEVTIHELTQWFKQGDKSQATRGANVARTGPCMAVPAEGGALGTAWQQQPRARRHENAASHAK